MFGVGLPELAVILVVAVVVFGPDRLPDYARQAGQLVRQLRAFARTAQQDLRNELGPEYADLKLTDLDPRVAIRKHILEALDDEDYDRAAAVADVAKAGLAKDVLGPDERPPYDVEAT
jgi:sec-independent protein translocase protein TatB